jgi:hypothetical protein
MDSSPLAKSLARALQIDCVNGGGTRDELDSAAPTTAFRMVARSLIWLEAVGQAGRRRSANDQHLLVGSGKRAHVSAAHNATCCAALARSAVGAFVRRGCLYI